MCVLKVSVSLLLHDTFVHTVLCIIVLCNVQHKTCRNNYDTHLSSIICLEGDICKIVAVLQYSTLDFTHEHTYARGPVIPTSTTCVSSVSIFVEGKSN